MSLRSFCLRIFQHCPLLAPFSAENHMRAFEEFMQYKTRVPVRGAILLNEAMDSTVLVKGWKKGANWSFPRGKINKDEDDLDCAIREVYEETGFDIKQAGLVPKDDEVKYIQISMREQQIRLYVFRNIPMDTVFEPKTRKEISKVEWYKLSELPAFRKKGNNSHDDAAAASNANKFYMVAPFLVPLKKWVVQQKKKDASRAAATNSQLAIQPAAEEPLTEDDIGAHTEPAPVPSNGTPAIETMEGATRELQRLLKVQPPTQGLQMSPSTSAAGKGEALMALLRKSAESQQGTQQPRHVNPQVPHTSADLTYTNAPEPPNPHHHHSTQRQPASDYQRPPSFPNPPSSMQHAAPAYVGHQAIPQIYGRNPFMNSTQPQHNEPVLLHPQPLPPQVQQSVLTRGILPTPVLLDAVGQGGQHAQRGAQQGYQGGPHAPAVGQHIQQGGPNPFTVGGNNTYATQQQVSKPAQLTDHAMSLLNAFKHSPRNNSENNTHGNGPQDNGQLSAQQNRYPSVSWANMPTTQALNPAAQFLPQHMAPVAPTGTSPRAVQSSEPHAGPKHSQPTDTHRTALLEMFKKAGPRSPLSNEIRMQPSSPQQSTGFARHGDSGNAGYKAMPAAEVFASTSGANEVPVRANPELSLPYRAVQILSRPKQGEQNNTQDYASSQAQMQRLQQRLSPMGSPRQDPINTGRQGLSSPRDRTFMQQMEHEAKRSPQLNYAAAHAASLPYAPQSPSSASFTSSFQQGQQLQHPMGMQQRRKDSVSEQKQKLLSLFSKGQQQSQQASPTGFTAQGKGKGKEPASSSGTPRSRVASFASTGGNEPAGASGSTATSRRGSQTPISPADRNFLLSYLESVTNVGR
ncbi:hypothetical protein C7999DRAFT_11604 [Corynascus novoguineensis]|uniref:Nudix hydrolase domain-containing protein n=1 Tax=Corynascus novoguineensis TaxID=1126955 RepID=A0AAN7HTB2_9PEZI|nr:hypothetical protein C7999DRAFT_11604 [Corynascus novoguineensis]